ncbi:MAG TPA: hypothetical protein VFN61_02015 [Acidimicrobiales bacterium]|nr:hypothetical protein [Acidimicrobiales bacterium]
MGFADVGAGLRVGWWAGGEVWSPLAALWGGLVRGEVTGRLPALRPVLVTGPGGAQDWTAPGFTGEPIVEVALDGEGLSGFDVFVTAGWAEPDGTKMAEAMREAGASVMPVIPCEDWGGVPGLSVGPPFAVPEPALLARRYLSPALLGARNAYLRVAEGLPGGYVLLEEGAFGAAAGAEADLRAALDRLAERGAKERGEDRPLQVVHLLGGAFAVEEPDTDELMVRRRAVDEEARFQPEDWVPPAELGRPGRPELVLRVTNGLDMAAAVSGAAVVVARSGALMALAYALGVPHVALGEEGSGPSNFAAWTGDASALAQSPAQIVATIDNIFARRGRPPGLERLEATLDQALDEAASGLKRAMTELATGVRRRPAELPPEQRLRELEAANEALRRRLAAERLRFGERAALMEKAANTSVESAIKAVHGQDVVVRRRLEQTEREMRRLQEETAVQQAELRAIYATRTMKVLAPARQWYGRIARQVTSQ